MESKPILNAENNDAEKNISAKVNALFEALQVGNSPSLARMDQKNSPKNLKSLKSPNYKKKTHPATFNPRGSCHLSMNTDISKILDTISEKFMAGSSGSMKENNLKSEPRPLGSMESSPFYKDGAHCTNSSFFVSKVSESMEESRLHSAILHNVIHTSEEVVGGSSNTSEKQDLSLLPVPPRNATKFINDSYSKREPESLHSFDITCDVTCNSENSKIIVEHSYSSGNEGNPIANSEEYKVLITPKAMPLQVSSSTVKKSVDILMHKDKINILRTMSRVFNEEQPQPSVSEDVSSASEDEGSEKSNLCRLPEPSSSVTAKQGCVAFKAGSVCQTSLCNIIKQKTVPAQQTLMLKEVIPALNEECSSSSLALDSKAHLNSLNTVSDTIERVINEAPSAPERCSPLPVAASSMHNKPKSSQQESMSVNRNLVPNEDPNKLSYQISNYCNDKDTDISVPEEDASFDAGMKSPLCESNDTGSDEKVYHVSSYSRKVKEKINVESLVGEDGEHIDIIDGFSFVSFQTEHELISYAGIKKRPRCKKILKLKMKKYNKSCHAKMDDSKAIEADTKFKDADVTNSFIETDNKPHNNNNSNPNDILYKSNSRTDGYSKLQAAATEAVDDITSSAFSSNDLDNFLSKNTHLNISYDIPACTRTEAGVTRLDGSEPLEAIKEQKKVFSSQETSKTALVPSKRFSFPSTHANAATSRPHLTVSGSEPRHSSERDTKSTIKELENNGLPKRHTPQHPVQDVSDTTGSDVFVYRAGKLVPLTSVIKKKDSLEKMRRDGKGSELVYVYDNGKVIIVGGSMCRLDPSRRASVTARLVMPIGLGGNASPSKSRSARCSLKAVHIDEKLAKYALTALQKPHQFLRPGRPVSRKFQCTKKSWMSSDTKATKTNILDILSAKLSLSGSYSSGTKTTNQGNLASLSKKNELARNSTLMKRNLHRFPILSREMRRLDVNFVNIDSKNVSSSRSKRSLDEVDEGEAAPCTQDHCRLGCVCASLQCHKRDAAHCGRAACMLGCKCYLQNWSSSGTPTKGVEAYSILNINKHHQQSLALKEKDFRWTVVNTGSKVIMCGSERKRERKVPDRYRDSVYWKLFEEEQCKRLSLEEHIEQTEPLQSDPEGEEGVPPEQQLPLPHRSGCMSPPHPRELEKAGIIPPSLSKHYVRPCRILVPWYRLPSCLSVWCLTHCCYDCPCRLPGAALPSDDDEEQDVLLSLADGACTDRRRNGAGVVGGDAPQPEDRVSLIKVVNATPTCGKWDVKDKTVIKTKEEESLLAHFREETTAGVLGNECNTQREPKLKVDRDSVSINNSLNNKLQETNRDGKEGLSPRPSFLKVTKLHEPGLHSSHLVTPDQTAVAEESPAQPANTVCSSNGNDALLLKQSATSVNQQGLKAQLDDTPDDIEIVEETVAPTVLNWTIAGDAIQYSVKVRNDQELADVRRKIEVDLQANGLGPQTLEGVVSTDLSRQGMQPECVLLELKVSRPEAGSSAILALHNIIKHWSHDLSSSARTCGYSQRGRTHRVVVNPHKQGFDYTPPLEQCNSNATIKSVLSSKPKRGFVRDVQYKSGEMKYGSELGNPVFCANRGLQVIPGDHCRSFGSLHNALKRGAEESDGVSKRLRLDHASPGSHTLASITHSSPLASYHGVINGNATYGRDANKSTGLLGSRSSNCVRLSDTVPLERKVTTIPVKTQPKLGSPVIVPIAAAVPMATTTLVRTRSPEKVLSLSRSGGGSDARPPSLSRSTEVRAVGSSPIAPGSSGVVEPRSRASICSPPPSGEHKLGSPAGGKRMSLPEMMQAEDRRGELELDLSCNVPGTALLVAEARFRKLINMSIIGVTGLNKQSRCMIAPVESSDVLARMRRIQTMISNRELDVGPNMREIFFPPHQQSAAATARPRFVMIRCDHRGCWEIVGLVQKKSTETKQPPCDDTSLSDSSTGNGSLLTCTLGVGSPSHLTSPTSQTDTRSSLGSNEVTILNDVISLPDGSRKRLSPPHPSVLKKGIIVQAASAASPLPFSTRRPASATGKANSVKLTVGHLVLNGASLAGAQTTTSCVSSHVYPPAGTSCTSVPSQTLDSVAAINSLLNSATNIASTHFKSHANSLSTTSKVSSSLTTPSSLSNPIVSSVNTRYIIVPSSTDSSKMLILPPRSTSSNVVVFSSAVGKTSAGKESVKMMLVPSSHDPKKFVLVPSGSVSSAGVVRTVTAPFKLSTSTTTCVSSTTTPLMASRVLDPKPSSGSIIASTSNGVVAVAQTSFASGGFAATKPIPIVVSTKSVKSIVIKTSTIPTTKSAAHTTDSSPSLPKITSLNAAIPQMQSNSGSPNSSLSYIATGHHIPTVIKTPWAAVDLSIDFKSVKVGFLAGTIKKTVLSSIRLMSISARGPVTLQVKNSASQQVAVFGLARPQKVSDRVCLLLLGSSVEAVQDAYGHPHSYLFRASGLKYFIREPSGALSSFVYGSEDFLLKIASKKKNGEASTVFGTKFPIDSFRAAERGPEEVIDLEDSSTSEVNETHCDCTKTGDFMCYGHSPTTAATKTQPNASPAGAPARLSSTTTTKIQPNAESASAPARLSSTTTTKIQPNAASAGAPARLSSTTTTKIQPNAESAGAPARLSSTTTTKMQSNGESASASAPLSSTTTKVQSHTASADARAHLLSSIEIGVTNKNNVPHKSGSALLANDVTCVEIPDFNVVDQIVAIDGSFTPSPTKGNSRKSKDTLSNVIPLSPASSRSSPRSAFDNVGDDVHVNLTLPTMQSSHTSVKTCSLINGISEFVMLGHGGEKAESRTPTPADSFFSILDHSRESRSPVKLPKVNQHNPVSTSPAPVVLVTSLASSAHTPASAYSGTQPHSTPGLADKPPLLSLSASRPDASQQQLSSDVPATVHCTAHASISDTDAREREHPTVDEGIDDGVEDAFVDVETNASDVDQATLLKLLKTSFRAPDRTDSPPLPNKRKFLGVDRPCPASKKRFLGPDSLLLGLGADPSQASPASVQPQQTPAESPRKIHVTPDRRNHSHQKNTEPTHSSNLKKSYSPTFNANNGSTFFPPISYFNESRPADQPSNFKRSLPSTSIHHSSESSYHSPRPSSQQLGTPKRHTHDSASHRSSVSPPPTDTGESRRSNATPPRSYSNHLFHFPHSTLHSSSNAPLFFTTPTLLPRPTPLALRSPDGDSATLFGPAIPTIRRVGSGKARCSRGKNIRRTYLDVRLALNPDKLRCVSDFDSEDGGSTEVEDGDRVVLSPQFPPHPQQSTSKAGGSSSYPSAKPSSSKVGGSDAYASAPLPTQSSTSKAGGSGSSAFGHFPPQTPTSRAGVSGTHASAQLSPRASSLRAGGSGTDSSAPLPSQPSTLRSDCSGTDASSLSSSSAASPTAARASSGIKSLPSRLSYMWPKKKKKKKKLMSKRKRTNSGTGGAGRAGRALIPQPAALNETPDLHPGAPRTAPSSWSTSALFGVDDESPSDSCCSSTGVTPPTTSTVSALNNTNSSSIRPPGVGGGSGFNRQGGGPSRHGGGVNRSGRGKDSTHNEMERMRRKEIGQLFVVLQEILQQNGDCEPPADCKRGVWPKRMTLKMAIALLEAKRTAAQQLQEQDQLLRQQIVHRTAKLQNLIADPGVTTEEREATTAVLSSVRLPTRVTDLELKLYWMMPSEKGRPDSADEEYVLDMDGSDSNCSESSNSGPALPPSLSTGRCDGPPPMPTSTSVSSSSCPPSPTAKFSPPRPVNVTNSSPAKSRLALDSGNAFDNVLASSAGLSSKSPKPSKKASVRSLLKPLKSSFKGFGKGVIGQGRPKQTALVTPRRRPQTAVRPLPIKLSAGQQTERHSVGVETHYQSQGGSFSGDFSSASIHSKRASVSRGSQVTPDRPMPSNLKSESTFFRSVSRVSTGVNTCSFVSGGSADASTTTNYSMDTFTQSPPQLQSPTLSFSTLPAEFLPNSMSSNSTLVGSFASPHKKPDLSTALTGSFPLTNETERNDPTSSFFERSQFTSSSTFSSIESNSQTRPFTTSNNTSVGPVNTSIRNQSVGEGGSAVSAANTIGNENNSGFLRLTTA